MGHVIDDLIKEILKNEFGICRFFKMKNVEQI